MTGSAHGTPSKRLTRTGTALCYRYLPIQSQYTLALNFFTVMANDQYAPAYCCRATPARPWPTRSSVRWPSASTSACCAPGARMPSIRQFAATHGVSPFTVVAGYDRLVAQGYLESRRGAGFSCASAPSRRRRQASVLRAAAGGRGHAGRRVADPQHVPPGPTAAVAGRGRVAGRLDGRPGDRQCAAQPEPPEQRRLHRLRHPARLPAAAQAAAAQAGRARDRGAARSRSS